MALNFSELTFPPENYVTQSCHNWCAEQIKNNINNLEIAGLGLIVLASISLYVYLAYPSIEPFIKSDEKEKAILEKIIYSLPHFTLYLMIGFLLYYFFLA